MRRVGGERVGFVDVLNNDKQKRHTIHTKTHQYRDTPIHTKTPFVDTGVHVRR